MPHDSLTLRAGEIVVGCVTEDNPKYLGQTVRLVQSIRWFGGELAQARVVVGAVEHIALGGRRALEALGADIRIVPRFTTNGPANRLQMFEELRSAAEGHFLVLDCDTIVVRDPLPLLRRDLFLAKIANLPTVTHEVFERLFRHFGLELPPRSFATVYDGTPTIPYFNSGVISIPAHLARRLVPEWRRYNAILADDPSLVAPCEKHMHQAALAIALAVSAIPAAEAGAELNYQLNATHLPPPPGYSDLDPYIIHYHDLVDHQGMLLPCSFPRAQTRIDNFNERLREERSRELRRYRPEPVARSSPRQIAVVGMHRSGTSVVARLLHSMGCYAGEASQLTPPDVFNPSGLWEHQDVWALDEEVLSSLDASWLEPDRADTARLSDESRQRFVDRARRIASALDEHGTWMVKDPRLALLFPIWREALDHPIVVLVWREPLAVAWSVHRRDGLPIVLGLALWEQYLRAMLASTIGLPRVAVSYQDLVANPIECVARLHRDLVAAGAVDLRLPAEDDLRSMVDPALDRNGGSGDEGLINRLQSELLDALRSGAALNWEVVPPIQRATRSLLSTFQAEQRENRELRKTAAGLEALLEAVFASRSWRLGFGVSRAWRRIVHAREESAMDRWNRLARERRD